jgi:hypothetical protein
MLTAETSIKSLRSLEAAGKIQPAEQAILDLFTAPEITLTRKQIQRCLVNTEHSMELSGVCGRVNSLIKKTKLAKRGETVAPTGKPNETIGLPVKEHE